MEDDINQNFANYKVKLTHIISKEKGRSSSELSLFDKERGDQKPHQKKEIEKINNQINKDSSQPLSVCKQNSSPPPPGVFLSAQQLNKQFLKNESFFNKMDDRTNSIKPTDSAFLSKEVKL